MADRFDVDTSELDALADALDGAFDRAMDQAVAVTKRGAQNIKRDAVDRVTASLSAPGVSYLPHYPRSINYEVDESRTEVTAEIGPDRARRQGGRGLGVELGSVNTHPIPHMFPAFEDEEPKYRDQLARHVGDVVL